MKTGLGWQRIFESDLRKRIASIPTPRAMLWDLKRYPRENQRFSLVFFVFRRFFRFFRNRSLYSTNGSHFGFVGYCPDLDC